MKTPEPLTIERLYELCEQVKVSPPGAILVWREDLWALVEMAKQACSDITASEAVFGFASWLTCRKAQLTVSSTNCASPLASPR